VHNPKSIQSVIQSFIRSLKRTPKGLFNPWYHQDSKHDLLPEAPDIRRGQLQAYLTERKHRARFLFIAEALGYQGGHFTGIAMTSERILLGHQEEKYGIKPEHVLQKTNPLRTSRPDFIAKGMSEPTATIMWGTMIDLGIDPYDVVLWNAVPWHPYRTEKGLLSNRTPLTGEMEAGLKHLKRFISLFDDVNVVAVGRKCEQSLTELGIEHTGVRHPANGGAPKFRMQLQELVQSKK
jgi:uracil-DNA glycosylase